MPLDLMSLAEGASPAKKVTRKTSEPKVPTGGEDNSLSAQLEAIRMLDELQAKAAKPPSKPVASPAAEKAAQNETVACKNAPPLDPLVDWTCGNCSKKNLDLHGDCTLPADFNFCSTCGESKTGEPPRRTATTSAPTEDWACHCGEAFPASFLFCVECGLPAGAPKPPPDDTCGGCGEAMPSSFKFCPDCGTCAGEWASVTALDVPTPADGAEDWACTPCSDDVPGTFCFCPTCGSQKP